MYQPYDTTAGEGRAVAAFKLQQAVRASYWAVILDLYPIPEGNQWMVLWGEDLMNGVAAFGDTPEQAIMNFDKAMAQPVRV